MAATSAGPRLDFSNGPGADMSGEVMDIDAMPNGAFVLMASATEPAILNNALNEICNRFSVREFETRIGLHRTLRGCH